MRLHLKILVIAGLLAVSGTALAQDSTTGAVRGQVKDTGSGGEAAIGATVVATSPALQGTRSEMTDESGSYFLSNLPPGIYLVTVNYLDARVERSNVLVQLGQVSKVNINIDTTKGQGEVVKVEGRAPIIDQQSTKTGTVINEDYTKNVPTGRTFGGVLQAAPGSQGDTYGVSFGGSTSVENQYIVEGVNTTDPGFGTQSTNLPNEFVRETELITGGYNAEYGRATGGIVNVITKSGSNEFHGSVFSYWTPGGLIPDAKPVPRSGAAIDRQNHLANAFDMGGELGGPLVKDRLWFHVGFNPSFTFSNVDRITQMQIDEDQDGSPDTDENGFTKFRELHRSRLKENASTYFFTGKLTGQVNENHQGAVSFMGSPGASRNVLTVTGQESAGTMRSSNMLVDMATKWTSKLNDNKSQFDVVVGYHHDTNDQEPAFDDGFANQVRHEPQRPFGDFMLQEGDIPAACEDNNPADTAPDNPNDPYPRITNCPVPFYRVGGVGFLEDTTATRIVGKLDYTQRLPNALGHHEIKAGVDIEEQGYDSKRGYTGSAFYRERSNRAWRIQRYFTLDDENGEPCGDADFNGDGMPDAKCAEREFLDVETTTRNLGAYIRDSWSILPNLTFNAGVRYEQQTLFTADTVAGRISPATGEPISDEAFTLSNMVAPRLGLIYDPTQEGRARIYSHWGRFYESIPMDINVRAYGGEIINLTDLPAGACQFTDPVGTCDETQLSQPVRNLGGGEEMVAPGMKGQHMDEIVLGSEYEILPDFKLGASYIRRDLGQVIEDVSFDGGGTYIIANPGEADASAIADLRAEAADLRAQGEMALADFKDYQANQFEGIASFDKPNRTYDALQLTADKRFSNNFFVSASYTYSKLKGNFPGLFSPETGQLDPNLTSMYDLPDLMANRYGNLAADRPHLLKVDGFYRYADTAEGQWIFGGRARASSGMPHNTLGGHAVYGEGESYILPRGETSTFIDEEGKSHSVGRSPLTTRFDTHLAYGRKLSDGVLLEAFVNVFNLFNQQPEVDKDENYTFDAVNPIVGGDSEDLRHAKSIVSGNSTDTVVERNPNFGNVSARQAPLSMQFGMRLTF